jgi:polysaccharide deacetylase family protein (PEP-CTERM system associated)
MTVDRPGLIFSVDVEDWPQSTFDRRLPIGDYCADNTLRILDLLAASENARGTFFVLGKFAAKHPEVVKRIHAAGHEVASHGFGHESIFRMDRAALSADIARTTALLSDLVGERPRGYRAPDFSVVGDTLHALDVLTEQGYEYDSSIFPFDNGRYGIGTWPIEPVRVALDSGGSIIEFPATVTILWGRRIPISGGGYARLLPSPLLHRLLQTEATARSVPPVFYCHPYEIDPGEFRRLPVHVPLKMRLHQGLGRSGFESKLRMLFERFECCSFAQALATTLDVTTISYSPHATAPGTAARPASLGS